MASFVFGDSPTSLPLASGQKDGKAVQTGQVSITVRNKMRQRLAGRFTIMPGGGTSLKPEWFTFNGSPSNEQRPFHLEFDPEATQTIAIGIAMPVDTPPGQYVFKVRVSEERDPDLDWTEGPAVSFTVAELAPAPAGTPKWPIVAAVVLVMLIVLGGVVSYVFWPNNLVIPKDVIGATKEAAEKELKDLKLSVNSEDEDSDRPIGTIVRTEPVPGASVKEASSVTLFLARAALAVPKDIVGMPQQQAQEKLKALNLTWTTDPRDSDQPAGSIVDTDPKPGAPAPRGSSVHLFIARAAVVVPRDIVGKQKKDAIAELTTMKLKSRVEGRDGPQPADSVVDTDPRPGMAVPDGSVTLFVAQPAPIIVPAKVLHMPRSEAVAFLQGMGADFTIEEVDSGEKPDTVIGTRPEAGKEVRAPDKIVLLIAKLAVVKIPANLVGLPLKDAEKILQDLRLSTSAEPTEATAQAGTVVRSSPAPGQEAKAGEVVHLFYAQAAALITIPRIVGKQVKEALEILHDVGLKAKADAPDGVVMGSVPTPGTPITKDTEIALQVRPPVAPPPPPQNHRTLAIMNAHSNLCLSPAGGNRELNDPIVQFTCDQDRSRFWNVNIVNGSDIAEIVNVNSGLCLTIAGGNVAPNIVAVQFTCDDDVSRRWRLVLNGLGKFRLVNMRSNLCLTIAGGGTDKNVKAVQFPCDGDPSRDWKLAP